MNRPCLNSGGAGSRVELPLVPVLEEAIPVSCSMLERLAAWQVGPGEIITAVDPEGGSWRVRSDDRDGESVLVPLEQLPVSSESSLQLHLFQALPQQEEFELLFEAATELGVKRIVPFESQRSAKFAERDARQKNSHRWPDVVLQAAKQCRRVELPELSAIADWDAALYEASYSDLKLILYDGECQWHLREVLEDEKPHRIALMVGPEGGFSADEVIEARQLGFLPVTLGSRLLRTETAALTAIALIQSRLGDLG